MADSLTTKPIVVIGGGLAGCTAALHLARQSPSTKIVLIEAKSRLGGRVGSYTDSSSGLTIDYCQHVGMNCCTTLKQLISWLGQESQWRTERELFFYGPQKQRQRLRGIDWLPPPLHLSGWLWNWPGLRLMERMQIGRGMLAINRLALVGAGADKLDTIAAEDWLRKHGQSSGALERFWSTIIVSALGEQLDRVSILPVAKVFQDGFLRQRDAWHLLVPQQPLSELLGRQMHLALQAHDVDVRLSTNVTDIQWQQASVTRLTLSDGTQVEPHRVIVAIPWHGVSDLADRCPDAQVQQIATASRHLTSSPISGVHTWWDQAWLPTPHAVLVDRLCQWIFPHASDMRDKSGTTEHYYQVVISASRSLPKGDAEQVRSLIEDDLREIFPEAAAARLLRVRVVTDPQAVFSVAPGTGQLRPEAGCQTGNLIWAGDWTSTGWPATMEGAIRSGLVAGNTASRAL